MKRLLIFIALLALSACKMAPTKVSESDERSLSILVAKTNNPLKLTDSLKVLDARTPFDYGLNRIKGSFSLRWQDLSRDPRTGDVMTDLHRVALRLSLLGLTPASPVLVVGYGPSGEGENGRLAWTLLYYGFHDVQVSAIAPFQKAMTGQPTQPAENALMWHPQVRRDLVISEREFERWKSAKLRHEHHVYLIDVRSPREYLSPSHPDIQALNVEWKEFYTESGRPSAVIRKKLLALGIDLQSRIIVFSNRGVRSGAAAYALMALGFTHVQNLL